MKGMDLLARPGPQDHLVQHYGEESARLPNVALCLKEGAERGERMVAVVTPSRLGLLTEQRNPPAPAANDVLSRARGYFTQACSRGAHP